MKENGKGRLVSWKEIAAYLGCDVRTCLRWEKERGLPVHRPGGTPGPRVYAWQDELDAWIAEPSRGTSVSSSAAPASSALFDSSAKRNRRGSWILAGLAFLAGLGLLAFLLPKRDRLPFDFHIEGSRLIIVNKAGEPLWRYDTKMKDLWPEADYRESFQIRRVGSQDGIKRAPALAIEDIDGDGRLEILFVPHRQSNSRNSYTLLCFDDRGRNKWPAPFEGGRELTFGKKLFSRDYSTFFETGDIDGDGRQEIFVFSEHISDWPTQFVILSCDGRVRGEFWNSGRITDLVLADIDGNGRKEILIGGVHGESTRAFIAILDAQTVSGASPDAGEYSSTFLSAGTELAYVLLPLTEIDPFNDIHAVLRSLEVLADGRIRGQIAKTNLEYELDPRTLACLDFTFSINFKRLRQDAVHLGKARGDIDDAYRMNLKKAFLYWTGSVWTSTPSWTGFRSK